MAYAQVGTPAAPAKFARLRLASPVGMAAGMHLLDELSWARLRSDDTDERSRLSSLRPGPADSFCRDRGTATPPAISSIPAKPQRPAVSPPSPPNPPAAAPSVWPPVLSREEQTILDLTNQARKQAELPPLKPNAVLFGVARAHSTNMARKQVLA